MRYHTSVGSYPDLKAAFHMSGPQDESQVLTEVKALLAREGIHTIAVLYNHGLGERIEVYRKIPEPPPATTTGE